MWAVASSCGLWSWVRVRRVAVAELAQLLAVRMHGPFCGARESSTSRDCRLPAAQASHRPPASPTWPAGGSSRTRWRTSGHCTGCCVRCCWPYTLCSWCGCGLLPACCATRRWLAGRRPQTWRQASTRRSGLRRRPPAAAPSPLARMPKAAACCCCCCCASAQFASVDVERGCACPRRASARLWAGAACPRACHLRPHLPSAATCHYHHHAAAERC